MLQVVTPPTAEVIDLATAKSHLRVTHNDEDALISSYVAAALGQAENYTGLVLRPASYCFHRSGFGSLVRLPQNPVISVTKLEYLSVDGVWTALTLSDFYTEDLDSQPARLYLKRDAEPPSFKSERFNVRFTFDAGYSDAASVPGPIKSAMLLIMADLYEHREDRAKGMPSAAEYLMNPFKVMAL